MARNERLFESEHGANKFAEKVNGEVKMIGLPDYNGTLTYWKVTWEDRKPNYSSLNLKGKE